LLVTCGNDATVRTWWYQDNNNNNSNNNSNTIKDTAAASATTTAAVAVDKHEATTQYDAPHGITTSTTIDTGTVTDNHDANSDTNGVESIADSAISTVAGHSNLSISNSSTTDSIDAIAIDAMLTQQQSIAIALLNDDAE
jgi:hypothetical protein